jgi:hypothetical protein
MTTTHHTLWFCILLPLGWYAVRALRRPTELVAPPLLACLALAGMFVFNYMTKPAWLVERFLRADDYSLLLSLASLCLAAFLLGYEAARRRPLHWRAEPTIPVTRLQLWCVTLVIAGFAGLTVFVRRSGGIHAFYGSVHGAAGAWEDTTAYIYYLPQLMLPAACLLLAHRMQSSRLPLLGWSTVGGVLGYFLFQGFVFGNRLDITRLFLVLITPWILLRPPSPVRLVGACLLGALALGTILVLPHLRQATHLNAEVELGEALSRAKESDAYHSNISGDELFYAAGLVAGLERTGTREWGLRWLFAFVNFVPRFAWPEKHAFFGSRLVQIGDLAGRSAGYEVASGAASGGIADGFLQFGWLSPLVWVTLGAVGARVWLRATVASGPLATCYLVAYLIGMTIWLTQGFYNAFQFWLFFAAPTWVAGHLGDLKGRGPTKLPTASSRKLQPGAARSGVPR